MYSYILFIYPVCLMEKLGFSADILKVKWSYRPTNGVAWLDLLLSLTNIFSGLK